MITILSYYDRISLYHTSYPFFLKKKHFLFTQSVNWCLKEDKNSILFLERFFQHRQPKDISEEEISLLEKLRNKYKTIVFFCGQPEAGTNRIDIQKYTDRLFHKSVFSKPEDYKINMYGKNLFADYYHRNFGIIDDPQYIYQCTDSDKIPELSWNIGVGTYPRLNFPQRIGTTLARAGMPDIGRHIGGKKLNSFKTPDFEKKRSIDVHARIDPVTCPSIAYQRVLFLERIGSYAQDKQKLFLTGMVSQNQYYRELSDSKIVLSPFGWGEVCFRDFEAILAGALLVKPYMTHLVTWPNVYIPNETYVPVNWEAGDLLEKCEYYLNDEKERKRIASNAFEQYHRELSCLEQRFDMLLGEYL